MTKRLVLFLSALSLLASCQTFNWNTWFVSYNDLVLSTQDETLTLPGSSIQSAAVLEDKSALHGWKIAITLTKDGAVAFSHITERCIGKQLTIRASGKTILSATIMAPIPDGKITVTGYKRSEAQRIVDSMVKK